MPFFAQIYDSAIHYNYLKLAKLLKQGACIDERKDIWTSAGLLASQGYQGPVKFLISYGANPNRAALGAAAAGNLDFAQSLAETYQIPDEWIIQGAGIGGHEYIYKFYDQDLSLFLHGLSYGGHEDILKKYILNLEKNLEKKEFYLNLIYAAATQGHFELKQKLIDNWRHKFTIEELDNIQNHSLLTLPDAEYKKKYGASEPIFKLEMAVTALTFLGKKKYIEDFINAYSDIVKNNIPLFFDALIRYGHHTLLDNFINKYPTFLSILHEKMILILECGHLTFLEKIHQRYKIPLNFTFDQTRTLKARFATPTLLFNALKPVENLDFCRIFVEKIPAYQKILPSLSYIHSKKNVLNVNQICAYQNPEIQMFLRADILKNKLTPTLFCLLLTFIYPINYEDSKILIGFFDRKRELTLKEKSQQLLETKTNSQPAARG